MPQVPPGWYFQRGRWRTLLAERPPPTPEGLAVGGEEGGFGVERVQLGHAAGGEEEDDPFGRGAGEVFPLGASGSSLAARSWETMPEKRGELPMRL